MREAGKGAAGPRAQALQQRPGPAHLRERLAGGVEDVARALQDDHERVPAGGRVGAGQPGAVRSVREVLLRRGRAASAGLQGASSQGMILLVSCYELGRQPESVARAAAALQAAGFSTAVHDISLERLPSELLLQAELIAISAPMHTALQLGVRVAERARAENPAARVAFFGLYAALNAEHLRQRHCDFALGESLDD